MEDYIDSQNPDPRVTRIMEVARRIAKSYTDLNDQSTAALVLCAALQLLRDETFDPDGLEEESVESHIMDEARKIIKQTGDRSR